jgi:hypothetical protein
MSVTKVFGPVLALGVLCLLSGGCDSDTALLCTDELVPGICVSVVDAASGQPVACSACGWVIENAYSEALEGFCHPSLPDSVQDSRLYGAWERAGVYTVFIVKPGYRSWSRSGVEVTEDECHVHTVFLEACLERNE